MTQIRYSPDELLDRCRRIRGSCTPTEFMRSPKHQKTQEMWCAAHFGIAYGATIGPNWLHISDVDEQVPEDFWLEYRGVLHPFQITMVTDPERRMGDEYKNVNGNEMVAAREDWVGGTKFGASWVAGRIAAKAQLYGNCAGSLNLLVYLNFAAHEQNYDELCRVAHEPSHRFLSVWLMNGNGFCCIRGGDHLPWFPYWHPAAESLAP